MRIILLFISRFFKSPRQEWRRSSYIFMVVGIIISVASLTVTFSIFEGYQRVLKRTLLDTSSHIFIFSGFSDNLAESDLEILTEYLSKQPEIEAFGPVVIEQAMITASKSEAESRISSCSIRGLDWENEFLPFKYREYIESGTWKLEDDNEIVIGNELAKKLAVKRGDLIYLVSPAQSKMTLMGLQSQRHPYRIAGIYHSGIYEEDSRRVFLSYNEAWKFSQTPGQYTRMDVRLKEDQIERADYLSYVWENELHLMFSISCWQDFNGSLFDLLQLQKWVLFFILSFLIVVASFNVVSTVSATIVERRYDIGILRATGFSRHTIRGILLGRILGSGFLAVVIGELLGMFLAWLASIQNFFQLKGDVYFLDRINVYFSLEGMLLIAGIALVIITIAALFPLREINRLQVSYMLRR